MHRTPEVGFRSEKSDVSPARLVVPERLVLDDSVRNRLLRTLSRSPRNVLAVGAEVAPLASGSSYRVEAEWRSLDRSPVRPAPNATVHGAVALRGDTPFSVENDSVRLEEGAVVVDPGAHVHDPRPTEQSLTDAAQRGRSPFPRRPIVCFLGLEPDPYREDWARRFVNRLIRRDIEARLLTPSGAPGGLHLTRPASPSAGSIAALGPDVIIALDREAEEVAAAWCTRRETTIVPLDTAGTEVLTLVPWELSKARGRIRARIGLRADAPILTDLVLRLSAGPQPEPPDFADQSDGSTEP